jgi:hypothetical protein
VKYLLVILLVVSLTGPFSFAGTRVKKVPDHEIPGVESAVSKSPSTAQTLSEQGKDIEAFELHYLLATLGDDRSQYQAGVIFLAGIEGVLKADIVEGLAWMIASQSTRSDTNRIEHINAVKKSLTVEQLADAEQRSATILAKYGSAKRVKPKIQFIKPLMTNQKKPRMLSNATLAGRVKNCSAVGTRIRSNCTEARQFYNVNDFYSSPLVK